MNWYYNVLLGLLVLLSGCIGFWAPQGVDIAIINVSTQNQNGTTIFHGELAVLDQYDGEFVINDVRIVFFDKNDKMMKVLEIGKIPNTTFSTTFSVELEEPPEQVRIQTGRIRTDASVEFHGVKRNKSGGYESFSTRLVG